MAIINSQLAQLTARAGVLRAGTGRAGAHGKSYELKNDNSGQIIWQRPVAEDGNPDDTVAGWTTLQE